MSDTVRSFIAIELPEEIILSLGKIQEDLRSYGFEIKWVRPENIHLTLKFLGDVDPADTEKIGAAISDAVKKYGPLSLTARGIGTFPNLRRPRVIWTGITGQYDHLTGLQKSIDDRLETIGFQREKRPFEGHLTLGRVKQRLDSSKFMEAMKTFAGFESEIFTANEIVLFKSKLTPTGAVYTKLRSVSLKK